MADPMLIARAHDKDAQGHLPVAAAVQPPRPDHRRHRHRQDGDPAEARKESFANIGVPVFVADIKGDLSGIAAVGEEKPWLVDRLKAIDFNSGSRGAFGGLLGLVR